MAASPPLEPSGRFCARYRITEREMEIMRRVLQAHSNGKNADELFISLSTVKTHVRHIIQKTGVTGRYGLIQNRED
jgi:DNA-binding CsgD family transcriptional regulator